MQQKAKISVIFWGTPEFAVPSLRALNLAEDIEVKAVFTQPDRKVGRRQEVTASAVKAWAVKEGLLVFQEKADFRKIVEREKPDLNVVVAYGALIDTPLLELPRYGSINLHCSLLPKYRGASPIQSALLNGEKITGVTIIQLVKKLDAGPIWDEIEVTIEDNVLAPELTDKLAKIGADLLVKTVLRIIEGNLTLKPQDDQNVSYCKKITREIGKIDWEKTADEIFNQYRAFYGWPGIYTFWKGKRLKLLKIQKREEDLGLLSGQIKQIGEESLVATKKGSIQILKLQLEGKQAMEIEEFLRGYPDFSTSLF